MSRFVSLKFMLLSLLCTLIGSAVAQQYSCGNATSMQNVNMTQFEGTWFEVARNPNVTNMGCIEIDLAVQPGNTTLEINVTYVDTQASLWANSTMHTNLTFNSTNTNGYNVSFSSSDTSQPQRMLKLLSTDYQNYALICGYTNASNESTVFSAILTRVRMPSTADLVKYEQTANQTYLNFNNMSVITQTDQCYRTSGAAAHLPMVATILAVLCALLK